MTLQRSMGTSSPPATLSATTIERHFGRRPEHQAQSSSGLSAALWDIGYQERAEISRPGCPRTNVVSVWTRGATYSDVSFDGVRRFNQMRGAGSFQMARAGETLNAVLTKTSGECLDLYLPTDIISKALDAECDGTGGSFELLPVKVEFDPDIAKVAATMVQEIKSPGLASGMALEAATLALALTLIRRWSNQAQRAKLPQGGLAPWQVRRALERLDGALHENISLKDLAAEVGLSPFHFARGFKASVGAPPHRHLVTLRLERGRRLLETSDLSIADVAERVGYSDPNYFSKEFKRMFHIGPRGYRQQRRS